ncbi:MAG: aminomethyltransferase family protein [Pseudomonadota bacterium]
MSVFADPQLGIVPGPVHERLEEQSRAKAWYNWAGYAAPSVLDNMEFEYFALRNQSALLDISPMCKYRLSGPQVTAMLNRLVTRDVRKIPVGRVGYAIWCDEEGMVIDDGTLFHLAKDDWRLCCQERMLTWLLDAAWGYHVRMTDESDKVAGLALQGPTSYAVLQDAGFDLAAVKPFELKQCDPDVMVSRTGFTGDLGYELWCTWEKAQDLWDTLWTAGRNKGLRAIGYDAVNLARIEAGFLTAGVDFQPVLATERQHRGQTPFELGLGRLVDFQKGHFNGRRMLLATQHIPRSVLMRFDVEGFKPAEGALVYHRKTREVGHITSGIWSPTAKRNIALAHVKTPYGTRRATNLWAEIYTLQEGKWDTRMARLTPVDRAFFLPSRARATPPDRI